jgi:HK97 family phage portal protein
LGTLARALKAIPFPGGGWGSSGWVQVVRGDVPLVGERDYRDYVGDGTGTSIVEICLNWITAQFPEAPPALWTKKTGNVLERIDEHPMLDLLRRPNFDPKIGRSWYTGIQLMMATLVSWNVDGNAYWLKVRNRFGVPIQLWYIPHWLIRPAADYEGRKYITHYEYRPRGQLVEIPAQDLVHLRFGVDPEDTRLGWSQLKGELKLVATDEERARFAWTILRNLGFPGVVIAPKGEGADTQEIEDPEAVKQAYMAKFTGNRRGEPLVMKGPTEVTTFGFDPKSMDLISLSNNAEERIAASLRVPAAVAGFGAGLEEAHTNATYRELREQAWEQKLIPDGRILAGDIYEQLATEYFSGAALGRTVFGFDLSQVRALQDDELKKAQKWEILVRSTIAEVGEGRSAFDLDVRDEHKVRLIPISVIAEGEGAPEPEPVPAPPAGGELPPAPPQPALPAGGTPPKELVAALQQLRLAAARIAHDGAKDDQVAGAIAALERQGASRDEALVKGLTELARAIAARPIDVAILETAKVGEEREVVERDEHGGIRKVRVTPLPAAHKNGEGGSHDE